MSARAAVAVAVGVAVTLWGAGRGTLRAHQVLVSPSSVTSASDDPALTALLETAEQLFQDKKKLPEALAAFERALRGAQAAGNDRLQARALAGLGETLYDSNDGAAARERALAALAIYERLADVHGIGRANHLLGLIAKREGTAAEAKSRYERAIAAFDAEGNVRARASSTLGLLSVARLPVDEASVLFARVVRDAESLGNPDLQGRALHSWGDHLFTAGAYEAALDKLEASAVALTQAGADEALGTVYNSLGRLYRSHRRLDAALTYQLKALALHEKTGSPFFYLQSLNAVAVTYQTLGDTQQARAYYDRALTLAEVASAPRVQDLLRGNLASTLIEQGEYARAARLLEQVLSRGLDVYPIVRYTDLSTAYLRLGRREDALAAAMKAVETCGRQSEECPAALDHRAEVHAALGNQTAALADVRAALDTLEAIRARLVPSDFLKQQFTHAREDVYSRAIALEIGQADDRRALETAELARSRAFIDLLASRDIRIASGAARTALPAGLTFRGGGETRAARELPSLSNAAPARTDDLIATAARLHSTLVVYWVTRDRLFIWTVSPDGAVQAVPVNVRRATLEDLVRRTAPFTDQRGDQRGQASPWRQLYDLLIAPVRRSLPRAPGSLLTIVPHGPLGAVAFAALQNEQGRYLLEDYTLHYVPAGAVLQYTQSTRHAAARSSGAVLVVADPALPPRSRLDQPLARLPGARTEAQAISRLVARDRFTALQDANASEARVREAVAGKAVLHFATHAIVRDDEPLASFLALGANGSERASDGLLSADEIYGLDLSADLVVLSACRSAGGRVTGDGIATFARAFLYAGTPSLIASLWDVADEPTNRLLPDFYRAWLAGATKGRALRSAQLRLLRDLRAGKVHITTAAGLVTIPEQPIFWAGFALLGEPD